ncbi:MAG: hypothetical protein AAGK22_23095 [Acidobacteriota bacterium]
MKTLFLVARRRPGSRAVAEGREREQSDAPVEDYLVDRCERTDTSR